MPGELEGLIALLTLENVARTQFRSMPALTHRQRLYGGQIVAQALMAAGLSVASDRPVHSLHAYFLKGGQPFETITFSVDLIRESGAFTVARVVAEQASRTLLSLEVSFHALEDGPEAASIAPDVPAPEQMIPIDDWQLAQPMPDQERSVPYFLDALEYRQSPDTLPGSSQRNHSPIRDVWVRTKGVLPDWPLLHACVMAYASDKPLLGTTVLSPPISGDPRGYLIASLDHSMWFHRPCRADEWNLMHLSSSTTGQARAFTRGDFYRLDGTLAISATQQGLVRPLPGLPGA